jgi:pimeloyl-ACP methyl ester carboxylesterase
MTEADFGDGSGPTVALVHGAFADSAGWNDVVAQLLADGVKVRRYRIRCAGSTTTPPTSPAR